jgi:hypothetical protein
VLVVLNGRCVLQSDRFVQDRYEFVVFHISTPPKSSGFVNPLGRDYARMVAFS